MSGFASRTNSRGSDGEGFPVPPAGQHLATLVAMIDLGEQEDDYGGESKWQRKAYFVWELVDEKIEGTSTNHVIGLMFTVSMNKKAKLRNYIERWMAKQIPDDTDFDPADMLGKSCSLTIVHGVSGERTYAKVDGVGPVMKGTKVPQAQRKTLLLDNCDKIDTAKLPDWLPYIYGKPVKELVEDGKKGQPVTTSAPVQRSTDDMDADPVECPF